MSRLRPLVVAACHIPATLLVAAAAGHWSRGFFPCVCSVVGGCGALRVFIAQDRRARRWMWAMVAMDLRSLLPVHLGRPTWQGFALLVAGIFPVPRRPACLPKPFREWALLVTTEAVWTGRRQRESQPR